MTKLQILLITDVFTTARETGSMPPKKLQTIIQKKNTFVRNLNK
jgi:hypothetical protein